MELSKAIKTAKIQKALIGPGQQPAAEVAEAGQTEDDVHIPVGPEAHGCRAFAEPGIMFFEGNSFRRKLSAATAYLAERFGAVAVVRRPQLDNSLGTPKRRPAAASFRLPSRPFADLLERLDVSTVS